MADNKQLSFICLGRFTISGFENHVTLTHSSISWQKDSKPNKGITIPLKQILAVIPCDCSRKQRSSCQYCQQTAKNRKNAQSATELLPLNTQAFKLYYAIPKGKYLWRINSVALHPLQDSSAKEWISMIRKALQDLKNRTRSLLVFINPFGGKKKGVSIYRKTAEPIFQLAGIQTEVIVTERANHAQDMIQTICLDKYDGIVCVGGDGMFTELMNGIILKAQQEDTWATKSPESALRKPKMPIGVIPAGSTDAVAYCTNGINDVVTSTLLIAMGDRIGVDVNSIHHDGLFLRYAISFLAYGYFGDTLVESEKHRWMGPARYNWSGFKTFVKQRSYEGELTMEVLKPSYVPSKHDRCIVGCAVCSRAKSKLDVPNRDLYTESGWATVSGKFKAINSATLTCRCGMSKGGISPTAHLGDGCTDIILVKKCSTFEFLRFLIRTALNNSSPLTLQHVEFYRVKQFHFTPYQTEYNKEDRQTDSSSNRSSVVALHNVLDSHRAVKTSSWNCDGEILIEPEISVRVHCQLINVYGFGIEDREKTSIFKTSFKEQA